MIARSALFIYRLAIQLLLLGLRLASAFGHVKARAAWRGRKGQHERLLEAAARASSGGRIGPWMHFHCASLGEFEQGAPVIRTMRERNPDAPILLTFFSPSGMEGAQVSWVDHIDYLPFDTRRSMRRFYRSLDIQDTVLVKYELWPEMMDAAHRNGTRLHLITARFDPGRHPLGPWGSFIRRRLSLFSSIQVQDKRSAEALEDHGLEASITGDPRADRVISTSRDPLSGPLQTSLDRIRTWKGHRKLIVVGSAWPAEWSALKDIARNHEEWAVLFAPHETGHPRVRQWAETTSTALWSGLQGRTDRNLILDKMGILKVAYGLADFAVVGGGWGHGVHNVLEPAAFGIPILCGPRIDGFREVEALRNVQALKVCDDGDALYAACSLWMVQDADRLRAGAAALEWLRTQEGATDRIILILEATRHGKR